MAGASVLTDDPFCVSDGSLQCCLGGSTALNPDGANRAKLTSYLGSLAQPGGLSKTVVKRPPAGILAMMSQDRPDARPPELLPPPPSLILRRQPYHRMPALAPAIGMHSTARDVGKLMLMLLGNGLFKKKPIVQQTTMERATGSEWTPHSALPGHTLLGMAEMYHGSQRFLVCEGTEPAGGTSSVLLLLPDKSIGLFVALNCYGQGAAAVRPTIAERFLDYYFPLSSQPVDGAEAGDDAGRPGGLAGDASGYSMIATTTGGDSLTATHDAKRGHGGVAAEAAIADQVQY